MRSVIGIDEVGRGCWAGPLLVVAARQTGLLPDTVADSKLLTRTKRQKIYFDVILACEIGEGWVSSVEIDRFGLSEAMKFGVQRALNKLNATSSEKIIIDGNIDYCPSRYTNSEAIINADADHPIVSAASIIAKIRRDEYMADLAKTYPQYGFEKHVGYGTRLHLEMLKLYGTCQQHRLSFRPIKGLNV